MDNPIIKLKNGDECTIEEFNKMISDFDCKVCYRYAEVDAEDEKCAECLNGYNITHFNFLGIESINKEYEKYEEDEEDPEAYKDNLNQEEIDEKHYDIPQLLQEIAEEDEDDYDIPEYMRY